jgi:hypothetical protein
MCVIVDANVAPQLFAGPPVVSFRPVHRWLFQGNGMLVYGGENARELFRVGAAAEAVRQLRLAGRAHHEDDEAVDADTQRVRGGGLCVSDDPHVIALARISGARTLCSHDKDLHIDFRDRRLISGPRGAVYQNASHAHLLRHTSGCPGRARKRV